MPAPRRLQSCRNGRSVTPAMGATIRLFLNWNVPMRMKKKNDGDFDEGRAYFIATSERPSELARESAACAEHHASNEKILDRWSGVDQRQPDAACERKWRKVAR